MRGFTLSDLFYYTVFGDTEEPRSTKDDPSCVSRHALLNVLRNEAKSVDGLAWRTPLADWKLLLNDGNEDRVLEEKIAKVRKFIEYNLIKQTKSHLTEEIDGFGDSYGCLVSSPTSYVESLSMAHEMISRAVSEKDFSAKLRRYLVETDRPRSLREAKMLGVVTVRQGSKKRNNNRRQLQSSRVVDLSEFEQVIMNPVHGRRNLYSTSCTDACQGNCHTDNDCNTYGESCDEVYICSCDSVYACSCDSTSSCSCDSVSNNCGGWCGCGACCDTCGDNNCDETCGDNNCDDTCGDNNCDASCGDNNCDDTAYTCDCPDCPAGKYVVTISNVTKESLKYHCITTHEFEIC